MVVTNTVRIPTETARLECSVRVASPRSAPCSSRVRDAPVMGGERGAQVMPELRGEFSQALGLGLDRGALGEVARLRALEPRRLRHVESGDPKPWRYLWLVR